MFGSRDARVEYGGKGMGGPVKSVPKKKISANFKTPMVPKGEKCKKKAEVPPTTSVSGASGGGVSSGGECCVVVYYCVIVLLWCRYRSL